MLLSVLKERLTPDELGNVLREVGRRAAGKTTKLAQDSELSAKAGQALGVLEALGGAPRLEKEEDRLVIQSASCPFASAVKAHPEVCRVAETLVAQITGGRVREKCNKAALPPRCSFEITEKRKRQGG
jgi:predicted ArsR family transcriptional regulator